MAASDSIREGLSAVFDARVEAECFYQSLDLVQDEVRSGVSNPLIHSFRCQIERWALACDSLESMVRKHALPLMEDFEGVSK